MSREVRVRFVGDRDYLGELMQYQIFGEHQLPRTKVARGHMALDLSRKAQKLFWDNVDADNKGLSTGRGCYIFATRAGGGIKPWYVGQSKGPFRNEVFADHKQKHFNTAFNEVKRGTPVLLLIARCTSMGKLSKVNLAKSEADFIEKMLISHALTQNPYLINTRDTRFPRELKIPGLLNSSRGKQSSSVKALRTTLGV